mmetsp:Transcript_20574/g.44174  ORF Transcript_20574/g.44174 Transcript_20574/m.44174 type:complete len:228 (+) Transcript_20574:647-1330(+)
MFSATCHTCKMLSSATDAITQASLAFHAKSATFAVWPPWMKRSSGGPSSASSVVCSSPILERSHTLSRRSRLAEARMVSLKGDHCTWYTSSVCASNECSLVFRLRMSHSATVLSAEPVASRNSEKGLKARQLISLVCASTTWFARSRQESRESQIISLQSSPTEPKSCGWWQWNPTSSTTLVWPVYVSLASRMCDDLVPWVMSHAQTRESSEPDNRSPCSWGLHASP